VGIKRHLHGLSMDDQVELYLFAGGYAGINPVEGDRANLCLLVEEATLRAAGGQIETVIAAAGVANPALAARLAGARPLADTTCTVAAVDTQTPARLWSGLPRLGDAALMLPPLCGDGMAMALRGAELCAMGAAAYLRGDCTLAEWEAAYTAAWRREFEERVRLAHIVQGLLLKPSLADALLALGARLPWAADYVVRATRGSVGNLSPLPTSESG
jgi:flavin-dependent dehydrogenase